MTRVEPHNAVCDRCGGLLVEILTPHVELRLDAAPHTTGEWRAWHDGTQWRARPASTGDAFHGSRRREHICILPHRQLELGAA